MPSEKKIKGLARGQIVLGGVRKQGIRGPDGRIRAERLYGPWIPGSKLVWDQSGFGFLIIKNEFRVSNTHFKLIQRLPVYLPRDIFRCGAKG